MSHRRGTSPRAAQRVIVAATGSLVEMLPEHDALRLMIRLLDDLADFQRELDSRLQSQESQR